MKPGKAISRRSYTRTQNDERKTENTVVSFARTFQFDEGVEFNMLVNKIVKSVANPVCSSTFIFVYPAFSYVSAV